MMAANVMLVPQCNDGRGRVVLFRAEGYVDTAQHHCLAGLQSRLGGRALH